MLNIVVALSAEAEPIVRHFGLVPRNGAARFKTYGNDEIPVRLVVSGAGRKLAAMAAAFLGEKSGASNQTAWLNVGIAGQRNLPVGTPVLADRITDDTTESSWYPPIPFQPFCKTFPVRTVDQPVSDYPTDDVYDMEASGFYGAASRMSNPGTVHVLKVISDNRLTRVESISRNGVIRLMEDRMGGIERIVTSLMELTVNEEETAENED
ncbi:MAG: hypothetical protein V3U24_07000 [Candidatus Neomarinimicrobiota bacterium]